MKLPISSLEWVALSDRPPSPHLLVLIAIYSADDHASVDVSWYSENPSDEYFPNDPDAPLAWIDGFGVKCLSGERPHHVKFWAELPRVREVERVPKGVEKIMTSLLAEWERQLKADKARLAEMEQDVNNLRESIARLEQAVIETKTWLSSNSDKVAGGD